MGWLPSAVRDQSLSLTLTLPAPGLSRLQICSGRPYLTGQVLEPIRMALRRMPRPAMHQRVDGTHDVERHAFIGHFDLYTQRGGG